MRMKVYGVYEGDKLIFQGLSREIQDHFNTPRTNPSSYTRRGGHYLGKYIIKHIGDREADKLIIPPKAREEERMLEYLTYHLNKYGNTVFAKRNPDDYIEKLKERGINCKARKVCDKVGKKYKSYYYIFEVI